jgi:replicative DNA helicase
MAQPREKVAPASIKVPPHNMEAERSILAGILINNDALNQVLDVLAPDDFYREAHMHLFEGMIGLYNNSEPIDLITLSHHLDQSNRLETAGGTDYLASLVDAVSTSAGIGYHAKIVRDLSVRRKLIAQCSNISESCFQNWQETDELLDTAEQTIFAIAEERVTEGFSSLDKVVKGSFKMIESVAEQDGFITGVPTGFKDFDNLTAGLQPSDLIIIAGRPSMGKTALALNLGMRLLGFEGRINIKNLRTGAYLGGDEWRKLTEAASHLSELPIFVDDSSGSTVLEMKAKCRRLLKKTTLDLVIVDYLQLIQGRRSAESRQQEISEISRSLKALAKDLNVPVVALSQLNRKVEDRISKKPQLADLRESGAIEQDADVIVFIYKDDAGLQAEDEGYDDVIRVDIAKQRNGPTGPVQLTFQRKYTRFRDYAEEEGQY